MIRFSAKYYDGAVSRAHDVEVSVDETGTLRIQGLEVRLSIPLSEVRISARIGNTVRTLALPGGAKCETTALDVLDGLERQIGVGRGNALLHRLEAGWLSALSAALVLMALIGAGFTWGVPALARHVAHGIPDALAYDLGQGTLALLDKSVFSPSELAPATRTELQAGFQRLAKQYPDLPLQLQFRRARSPNAFALPNGSLIVTDELVELATHPEQVLSVLAHEIGHIHHRHGLRLALESSSIALLLSAYLGDVAQLTTLSASLPAVLSNAHFSRNHETEADSFALEHLQKTNIPPHHFADILRALQKQVGPDTEGTLGYLASHPPTVERVRRFEAPRQ